MVPQRACVTKFLPNFRVNFLLRFASKPLSNWAVPSNSWENSLVLFVQCFWLWGSLLALGHRWWFGVLRARDSRPFTELCQPPNNAHMLRNPTESMRDAPPQSICCVKRNPGPKNTRFRMQFFCLQLEASCLQLSFFVYSCVWELFCLQFELFTNNSSYFA